jgi:hypothetical protein
MYNQANSSQPGRSPLRESLLTLGLVTALIFPACNKSESGNETLPGNRNKTLPAGGDASAIRTIVTSEELILALTPGVASLGKGLLNLQLPDAPRQELFAPTLDVVDLEGSEADWQPSPDKKSMAADSAQLWSSLLNDVAFFEHAKFGIVKGNLEPGNSKRFIASVYFSAVARMKADQWCGLSAKLSVGWQNVSTTDSEDDWRITEWQTKEFSSVASDELWFQESLDEALPRPADVVSLRRSQHHEETITFYEEGRKGIPHRYFATISVNQKPGIAIADIDSDGDDDVFVTVRRGYNKLLENQGDGTFLETAKLRGLGDVKNHSTCALFADFDNDGDPDLMLGRSLLPCRYFINNGGRFTEKKGVALPRLALSMSAADYNNDGLLDVYVCTYRPAVLGGSSPTGGDASDTDKWPDEFLPPIVAKEYYKRHAKSKDNQFPNVLDQLGPPNVLLVNIGSGNFKGARVNAQIGVWRNSMQATWSDYDDDGDPDLYIANDWAADHLFRNDGKNGFADVTAEAGTSAFGFAMGTTWGDYDNDGKQDLYVTNMFSKAGQRITSQVEGLNAGYAESATGNYLYHQKDGGKFDLVSGLKPPAMQVAKAGWGWGGQFADFNNDGWLDIYSINGYFTAPKEAATEVDL